MSKLRFTLKRVFTLTLLSFIFLPTAYATNLLSLVKIGDVIEWQISSTSFTVDRIILTVTGPDQTGAVPAGCLSMPLSCSNEFPTSYPTFDTAGLSVGAYSWQAQIVPLVADPAVFGCQAAIDVREAQGGAQGLTGDIAPTPEDDYIECIKNAGLLPPDSVELTESGAFSVGDTAGLVVPTATTGTTDNIAPVAVCADIVLEGSDNSCIVNADINDGSSDPDGTLSLIVQDPAGPYSLGTTDVTLTVTDNTGESSSCSATVTVTDNGAPMLICPSSNTMTPPLAPMTFTVTSSDTCSVPTTEILSYDCYRFNKKGKRIDTIDSCIVALSNSAITVVQTSGVDSFIDWVVKATDSSGNETVQSCTIEVLHPNQP